MSPGWANRRAANSRWKVRMLRRGGWGRERSLKVRGEEICGDAGKSQALGNAQGGVADEPGMVCC